jgi:hypothetical protein
MVVKSFRGKIANNAIETINLHTNDGKTGYRIKKFEAMPEDPSGPSGTNVLKIFTIPQTTASVSGTIDFEDNTLLAAAVISHNASAFQYPPETVVIFDNVTFNQDLYVTQLDADGNATACNYHIELEMVKLDLNENTVATLKDIRNIEGQPFTSTP